MPAPMIATRTGRAPFAPGMFLANPSGSPYAPWSRKIGRRRRPYQQPSTRASDPARTRTANNRRDRVGAGQEAHMSANTDHVGKAYAGFARGDIPAILELLDDDVDWSAPGTLPQGGAFKGRDGVLKLLESIGAAWDQLTVQTEVIADVGDDTVVAIVDPAGTLRGGHAVGD